MRRCSWPLRGGGPAEFVGGADFNADGTRLAWGQVGASALADLATGAMRAVGRDQSFAAWFDRRDDTLLTAGFEGLARWRNGTAETLLAGEVFHGLTQTLDGRALAAITVSNWWMLNPEPRRFEAPDARELYSVALSPNARLAALGTHWDATFVADTVTGAKLRELPGHRASVAFDPAGRWLATGSAQEYGLWSVPGWQPLRRWPRASASARHSPSRSRRAPSIYSARIPAKNSRGWKPRRRSSSAHSRSAATEPSSPRHPKTA